jgi:hypothetical protein
MSSGLGAVINGNKFARQCAMAKTEGTPPAGMDEQNQRPIEVNQGFNALLLPYQQCKSRECKPSRCVIHHIHLAGVKSGFELGQRHV